MDKYDIFNYVGKIFIDVFDDDDLAIERSSNSDSIEDWDSLNHINLVVAIERQFGFKFSLNELEGLKNVGEMIDLISLKIR